MDQRGISGSQLWIVADSIHNDVDHTCIDFGLFQGPQAVCKKALLGGSWDLVTIYALGYNPSYNWVSPYRL